MRAKQEPSTSADFESLAISEAVLLLQSQHERTNSHILRLRSEFSSEFNCVTECNDRSSILSTSVYVQIFYSSFHDSLDIYPNNSEPLWTLMIFINLKFN